DWPARLERPKHLVLAGGVAAMRALAPLWERLGRVEGVSLRLAPVENRFFGPSVDVSGLITGSCLIAALGALELPPGSAVYLPEVMVRDRPGEFLDGLTTAAVSEALGLRLVFLPAAGDLLAARLLAAE
ncbi:MAG: DUF512 domain-containing protein, partial [Peptococcaceae bacterium]|nr:DUF512 domain-containing protein [Peptococcaceae bacterium]